MAELVDALDSKSSICEDVGVRFPLPAPDNFKNLSTNQESCALLQLTFSNVVSVYQLL